MVKINLNKKPHGVQGVRSRLDHIYIGIVKNATDGQYNGRMAVWIPELGGDPTDSSNWFIVRYASPFAGVTDYKHLVKDSKEMRGSQHSYGFWMQPPDLENQVLVCFANGNPAHGFWFACIYQTNMNHMVPGIASDITTEPPNQQKRCGHLPPVVEYNKWSDVNPASPSRAVFTPLANGLSYQGLYSDPERGTTSASVRRDSPAKTFGWLTPRGHQVYADDNIANEFIRLRTRSGAQILIHETSGYVYINSKYGNSWIEISDQGIDLYSLGAVSVRASASLNLHADGALNIEADGNLNLRAGGNLTMQSAVNTSIAGNGTLALQFGGLISGSSGADVLFSAASNLRLGAGTDITALAGGNNVRTAQKIYDNTSPSAPGPQVIPAKVEAPREVGEITGGPPCFELTTRQTIVRRLPTHEPFPLHQVASAENAGGNAGDGGEAQAAVVESDATEFPTQSETSSVAGAATVPSTSPSTNSGRQDKNILKEWITAAQASQKQTKVPASVTLAQFILESAWGKSGLTQEAFNGFGIKATSGQPFVTKRTREVKNGQSYYINAKFAKYNSLSDGFIAHGKLLLHSRYSPTFPYFNQPLTYADKLTGIYATDPAYGTKLKALMIGHNLMQYDMPS